MVGTIRPAVRGWRVWTGSAAIFLLGGALGGMTLGTTVGLLGSALPSGLRVAAIITGAGFVVLWIIPRGFVPRPPGIRRQVRRRDPFAFWGIGSFAWGLELGAGATTRVISWAYWAWIGIALGIGSPFASGLLGTTFGLSRCLGLIVPTASVRGRKLFWTAGTPL